MNMFLRIHEFWVYIIHVTVLHISTFIYYSAFLFNKNSLISIFALNISVMFIFHITSSFATIGVSKGLRPSQLSVSNRLELEEVLAETWKWYVIFESLIFPAQNHFT